MLADDDIQRLQPNTKLDGSYTGDVLGLKIFFDTYPAGEV